MQRTARETYKNELLRSLLFGSFRPHSAGMEWTGSIENNIEKSIHLWNLINGSEIFHLVFSLPGLDIRKLYGTHFQCHFSGPWPW
jgi:hypothetical protein